MKFIYFHLYLINKKKLVNNQLINYLTDAVVSTPFNL